MNFEILIKQNVISIPVKVYKVENIKNSILINSNLLVINDEISSHVPTELVEESLDLKTFKNIGIKFHLINNFNSNLFYTKYSKLFKFMSKDLNSSNHSVFLSSNHSVFLYDFKSKPRSFIVDDNYCFVLFDKSLKVFALKNFVCLEEISIINAVDLIFNDYLYVCFKDKLIKYKICPFYDQV